MGEKQRKKAIVVGAGVGGTATAARLAHAGLDVEVYEKNEFSGGRCSLIHHDGYRFDQVGPSLPCPTCHSSLLSKTSLLRSRMNQVELELTPRAHHYSSSRHYFINSTPTSERH
jgi:phytoene dehydrogenase-like protein